MLSSSSQQLGALKTLGVDVIYSDRFIGTHRGACRMASLERAQIQERSSFTIRQTERAAIKWALQTQLRRTTPKSSQPSSATPEWAHLTEAAAQNTPVAADVRAAPRFATGAQNQHTP